MTNWFEQGGEAYARYRPDYPDALAAFLADVAPTRETAVDVGCGNGQFTCRLAAHLGSVIGVDPSADQIANARPHDRVTYVCAPAEATTLRRASASLITAAQAAHWFDLPLFYREAARIARPGAILALVSYGIPAFDAAVEPRFKRFYHDEIGRYWPPERRLVETGYADIPFPFAEIAWPAMAIERDWDLVAFLGYLTTWSAVRRAEQAGQKALVEAFAGDIERLWGDPDTRRRVTWPIAMRLGRIDDMKDSAE